MAQTSVTVGTTWTQVSVAGSVALQKRGGGIVLLFVGAAAPTDDMAAFQLDDQNTSFGRTTTDPVWAKALRGSVKLAVLV